MSYFGMNKPGIGNTMYAPLIYEIYPVGWPPNTPIAIEDVHEPATWLMLADTGVQGAWTGVWGYTLAAWPLQYDIDGDGLLDSAEQNMPYNSFKPRVHPSVPVGLMDGHVETVDYESLWETYSDGDPVHDFWWDASCNDYRAK